MNKHLIWAIALTLIIAMICGTLIYLNSHPYIFEIGENMLEGIKEINWEAVSNASKV